MSAGAVGRFVRAHLYGAFVIGVFVVLLPVLLRGLDGRVGVELPEASWYAGLLVFPLGAALSYASFRLFITRGEGTAFPTEPPQRLVILGPYRAIRNPMYVGNLGMIFGEALLLRSTVLLTYAVVMCFVTHAYVTRSEEPGLTRRYGAPYVAYLRSTPRWVPRLESVRRAWRGDALDTGAPR